MNLTNAHDVARWRALDRHVQGLTGARRLRAQAVVDIAEDAQRVAASHGRDPVDDLLEVHSVLDTDGAKRLVADAVSYLRAAVHLSQRSAERVS